MVLRSSVSACSCAGATYTVSPPSAPLACGTDAGPAYGTPPSALGSAMVLRSSVSACSCAGATYTVSARAVDGIVMRFSFFEKCTPGSSPSSVAWLAMPPTEFGESTQSPLGISSSACSCERERQESKSKVRNAGTNEEVRNDRDLLPHQLSDLRGPRLGEQRVQR